MKKDVRVYIQHILDRIIRIGSYTKMISKEEFMNSRMIQDAIIRNFEVIGEATRNVSQEVREKYPEIEWKKLAGFRDVLIHRYADVVLNIVWSSIKELPELKPKIKRVLDDLEKEN